MNESTKRCPYCDEEIRLNAIKCKHCGSFISDSSSLAGIQDTTVRHALMGRFEVLETIGRGGMGIVYKAVQKNLNRTIALKVLPQQLSPDEEFLKRFHREAQRAAQLSHPNIITIHDEGVENGVHFIAMEYIDGNDLRNIILQQGAVPLGQMANWLQPVINALGYAHRCGVIHRDIKSANILISKNGRPVLTDFGIARMLDDNQATRPAETAQLTRPGTILGTLQFMSPEQITGKPVTHQIDIYALGVVMYHCLTGEMPFRGDTDWSTMHKITHDAPTAPRKIRADIPKAVESVVLRCMAKDPAQRFQDCETLASTLAEALHSPVTATSQKPASQSSPEDQTLFEEAPRTAHQGWLARIKNSMALPKFKMAVLALAAVSLLILLLILIWPDSSRDGASEQVQQLQPPPEEIAEEQPAAMPPSENLEVAPPESKTVIPEKYAEPSRDLRSSANLDAILQQAQAFLSKKEWQSAWDKFVEIQQQSPGDNRAKLGQQSVINGLLEEMNEFINNKAYASAQGRLTLLKQLAPGRDFSEPEANLLERWGDGLLAQNAFEQAMAKYDQALALKPNQQELRRKISAAKEGNDKWLGLVWIRVSGGSFKMGDETGEEDERPVHEVEVNDFLMSKFEVTFAQFDEFCQASGRQRPPDNGWGREDRPVINVSWEEANAFCEWLSQRTGSKVRLPTEAEWEYAAREGGKSLKWSGANQESELAEHIWLRANNDGKTHPVGRKRPNLLGLHDMSGNAYEWCWDRYDKDYYRKSSGAGLAKNPTGPGGGKKRVLRGGSCLSSTIDMRCANRYSHDQDKVVPDFPTGFRLVRLP